MGLSPEEKRKIYEEEKTRLEAQDEVKNEKAQKDSREILKGCLAVVVVLVIIGIAIATCTGGSDSPTTDQPTTYWIEYRVTGSAESVSLTYQNEDGGTSQISKAQLPWSYTFEASRGDFVYVSAQNNGAYGTVTATIYLNDSPVKSSSSSGAYVIATANGLV